MKSKTKQSSDQVTKRRKTVNMELKIIELDHCKLMLFPTGKIYRCYHDSITLCNVKLYTQIDPKTLKIYKYSRIHFNYKHYPASRLIATAFIENPNNFKNVRYKDGNPLNNSVDNLEWININNNYGKRDPKLYHNNCKSQYGQYNSAVFDWIINHNESTLYKLIFLDSSFRRYLYRGIWSKGVPARKIEDLMDLAYEKLLQRLKDHYSLMPGIQGEKIFRKYCYFIFVYYSTKELSIEFVPRELLNQKILSDDYFDYLKIA